MADDRTSIAAPPRRILVITLRRLGDVLLTTPLVRTLRMGFPDARIDMLVNRGTEGILAGNPDVSEVIVIPEKIAAGALALVARRLWRDYDLAISTQSGDRPTFLAWVAGAAATASCVCTASATGSNASCCIAACQAISPCIG